MIETIEYISTEEIQELTSSLKNNLDKLYKSHI